MEKSGFLIKREGLGERGGERKREKEKRGEERVMEGDLILQKIIEREISSVYNVWTSPGLQLNKLENNADNQGNINTDLIINQFKI